MTRAAILDDEQRLYFALRDELAKITMPIEGPTLAVFMETNPVLPAFPAVVLRLDDEKRDFHIRRAAPLGLVMDTALTPRQWLTWEIESMVFDWIRTVMWRPWGGLT